MKLGRATPRSAQRKFFVYIVESLSREDLRNGRSEGPVLRDRLRRLDLPVVLKTCKSLKSFAQVLREDLLTATRRYKGRYPILHVSAHGDANGIGLTDGTDISWPELRRWTTRVNELAGDRLIVCISACRSRSGLEMAKRLGSHPWRALVGARFCPNWADTKAGFLAFYRRRAAGADMTDAVEAMRCASGFQWFTFDFAKRVRRRSLA